MKKDYLMIIVILFCITTKTFGLIKNQEKTDDKKVTGNGNVTTEEREVKSFTKILSKSTFTVYVMQGDENKIKVETDDNVKHLLKTEVKNETLEIYLVKGSQINQLTKANVYITVKNITEIENKGIGNLTISDLKLKNKFQLNNEGTGNINMKLDCSQLVLKNKGIGNLTYSGISKTINMDNKSNGLIKIEIINDSSDSVIIKNDGVGNLNLIGKTKYLSLQNSGTGNIEAFELIAKVINLKNEGIGNVNINVEKELSITSKGTGNIKYKGNASIKEMNVTGIGGIKKIE